jgi:hypothetical protein
MIFHLPALRAPQKTPRKPQPRYFPPPISPSIHQLRPFPRSLIAWLRIGAEERSYVEGELFLGEDGEGNSRQCAFQNLGFIRPAEAFTKEMGRLRPTGLILTREDLGANGKKRTNHLGTGVHRVQNPH